mmetsp:Transcript_78239/g.153091  ORF Transcript_78239/g.153091 Transcript_78239/m.153091 type:complete len:499 (-) Transcript_78239:380-1876(-)
MCKMWANTLVLLVCRTPSSYAFTTHSFMSHLRREKATVVRSSSQHTAVTYSCRDGGPIDPSLLSDVLLELGASSVSCSDAAKGTQDESPIFRHHKNSPTWRGGAKGGADPALLAMDSLGVIVAENGEDSSDAPTSSPSPVGESSGSSSSSSSSDATNGKDAQLGAQWTEAVLWERTLVTATFPTTWDMEEVGSLLQLSLGLKEAPPYTLEAVPEEVDWVKKVQESWDPILCGGVLIRFPWHDEMAVAAFRAKKATKEGLDKDDEKLSPAVKCEVVLEGGAAFGTGDHPTTAMCLEWLQQQTPQQQQQQQPPGEATDEVESGSGSRRVSGQRVLDYGAGSGLLAIAALKLGAREAVGVEVDRDAIEASQRNAADNGVGGAFTCWLPPRELDNTLAGGGHVVNNKLAIQASPECSPLPSNQAASFSVCVANILAGPLTQLAPTVAGLVAPNGCLALSGVLHDQGEVVAAAYRPFFPDMRIVEERQGWLLLSGTRAEPNSD